MKKICSGLLLLAAIWFFGSCSSTGKRIRDLPLADKQFLSEVRYIITKKERSLFFNTPPAGRQAFIEDFWKKRDPNPADEENEFREEYYKRIEQANHLFREGSSGWLSDRGRVHILLGPPERRITYPMGYSVYEKPAEVWYYGYFPVVFIDHSFSGVYKLEPISAQQISMMNTTQMQLKPKVNTSAAVVFDFVLKIESVAGGSARLLILVPLKTIWLSENTVVGTHETHLQVNVSVRGRNDAPLWEKTTESPVLLTEKMLEKLPEFHVIEFPLQLSPGSYTAQVTVQNPIDKSLVSKKLKFKL